MADQDNTLTLRPSLIGSWFLFLGFFMALAIIYFERDPQGRVGIWYALSGFFLAFIIHRLSQKYIFDNDSIRVISFMGESNRIQYKDIQEIELKDTFATRVAGAAHLLIYAKGKVVTLLSQKDAPLLRERILKLAQSARGASSSETEGIEGSATENQEDGTVEDQDGSDDNTKDPPQKLN
ncbi:MAG: hypothetical protein LBE27_00140 [Deltaproteobacteria bacterium]|jgi:hypothetical protein|nr:hypothetical protein [Deltaproteobacteria bacterium]